MWFGTGARYAGGKFLKERTGIKVGHRQYGSASSSTRRRESRQARELPYVTEASAKIPAGERGFSVVDHLRKSRCDAAIFTREIVRTKGNGPELGRSAIADCASSRQVLTRNGCGIPRSGTVTWQDFNPRDAPDGYETQRRRRASGQSKKGGHRRESKSPRRWRRASAGTRMTFSRSRSLRKSASADH